MKEEHAWGVFILIVLVIGGIAVTAFSLYINNIPKIHNGHIIYVSQRYNKFYGYEWTDVEVLTYSGDTHHIDFWEHPEFELNKNYRIHTVIRCRFYLFPFPKWENHELITELEVIET